MEYGIIIAASYLMGSSSMAYWLSKMKHVDIRKKGSGNLGASNATVLFGWGAGVIVAVHDIAKAVLAVLLAKLLFPQLEYAGVVAGVGAVLGHIFPFYLKFKGGKGLASFLGMTLALNWKLALGVIVLLVVITLVTDYIALGTISVSIATPVGMYFLMGKPIMSLIICIATVVMLFKHWENVKRICRRTEIGLRNTARGENRIR